MARAATSDLEGVVLGLIWASGPCTAYAVRRIVQESLTAQWSGSAGAIYPAVTRLEEWGWIRGRAATTGRRPSRRLEITARGLDALRVWMGPPLDDVAAGIPIDPLRTRLRFLGALPPGRRRTLLDEARRILAGQLADVERDWRTRRREQADPFEIAMARGVLLMLRARMQWLEELTAAVVRP